MATATNAICVWVSTIILGAAIDIDLTVVLTAGVLPHSFRAHVER